MSDDDKPLRGSAEAWREHHEQLQQQYPGVFSEPAVDEGALHDWWRATVKRRLANDEPVILPTTWESP